MHAYQPERLNQAKNSSNPVSELVSAHPMLCGGAALSLLVMSTIFVNAVWYQNGSHPAPLFATRTINTVMPIDEKKTASVVKEVVKTKAITAPAEVSASSKEVLREVQTALSVRGYYQGKLDGVYGSRTKKAISQFQKDHSLKQDGKASVRLLTQVLMSASARPAEVPVPKKSELVQKPTPVKTVAVSNAKPEEQADGLVARIQSGLRAYGYDDLVVDGRMGQQTATAIQRFQLDYGMKITGEPSSTVLKKLRDIGAYKQG